MRDLALVLWLIGFPLGCALEDYVRTKQRGFTPRQSEDEYEDRLFIRGAILIAVSVFLCFRA